ncbi:hypothetical protein L1887_45977 [Cichorium endivia]|nr:hypothetical protein L1887_45977 [Cichorium endivia]
MSDTDSTSHPSGMPDHTCPSTGASKYGERLPRWCSSFHAPDAAFRSVMSDAAAVVASATSCSTSSRDALLYTAATMVKSVRGWIDAARMRTLVRQSYICLFAPSRAFVGLAAKIFVLWCTCIACQEGSLLSRPRFPRFEPARLFGTPQSACGSADQVAPGGKTRWGGCAAADLGLASADARFICTAWRRQKAAKRACLLPLRALSRTGQAAAVSDGQLGSAATASKPRLRDDKRARSHTRTKTKARPCPTQANLYQRCCATLLFDVQRGGGGSRHTHTHVEVHAAAREQHLTPTLFSLVLAISISSS